MLLRRYIYHFLVTLIILTSLFSCSAEQESPLRVGTNIWPGYEPFYLARDLGYYIEEKPSQLYQSAQSLLKLMLEEKLINHSVKTDDLFDPQWLPEHL